MFTCIQALVQMASQLNTECLFPLFLCCESIKVWCFDVSISLQTGFSMIDMNKQYDRPPYYRLSILWFIYVSLEALTACFYSQQHLKTSFEALNTEHSYGFAFRISSEDLKVKKSRWSPVSKHRASLLFLALEVPGLFCVFKAVIWGPEASQRRVLQSSGCFMKGLLSAVFITQRPHLMRVRGRISLR